MFLCVQIMETFLLFHSRAPLISKYGLPADAGRLLSNFGAIPIVWRGNTYATVEHAFQGAKYLLASNRPELEASIRIGSDPIIAKRAGSKAGMKAVGAVLDIDLWSSLSDNIMQELIIEKANNPIIRSILMICKENGIGLYHFSRSDMKWGCHVSPPKGENGLGCIYMELIRNI